VRNAAAAIDFYVAALGATELHRLVGDDGRIGHAQLRFGTSVVMLADEYPEFDVRGPESLGGSTCSFHLDVDDADAAYDRAIAHGATEVRPVDDQFHGSRQGAVRDPFGHRWVLSTPIAGFDPATYGASAATMGFDLQETATVTTSTHDHQLKHYDQGDLYYFTLPTPDLAKAQTFYGAVLGWTFDDPNNGHIGNISAPPGSAHGAASGTTDLYFVVDDIRTAIVRVREMGGTAEEPVFHDSGAAATCIDDQGTRFFLSVPADKYRT
jgi:PhnB protein